MILSAFAGDVPGKVDFSLNRVLSKEILFSNLFKLCNSKQTNRFFFNCESMISPHVPTIYNCVPDNLYTSGFIV